ncbi:uncharacterized protein [Spinacia oleracea]|uniref:Reverse transcriptase Ty1/copia-type domain-containing protein n=1 Tax=Spinacia oleracea TaxID=3562 RepID=A0A9R0HSN6_SPIOL|nr:uncharacterized protein LOC110775979 [Spinacia oleracea]
MFVYMLSCCLQRLYDLDNHNVFVSRDVIFFEIVFPYATTPDSIPNIVSSPSLVHFGTDNSSSNLHFHTVTNHTSEPGNSFLSPNSPIFSHPSPNPSNHFIHPDSPNSNSSIPSPNISLTSGNPQPPPNPIGIPIHAPRQSTRKIKPSSVLTDFVGGYVPHRTSLVPSNDSESLSFSADSTLTDNIASFPLDFDWLLDLALHNFDIWDSLAFSVCSTSSDPQHYNQAKDNENLILAMDKEIQALESNNTWDLTLFPKDKKAIGSKWVYRTKLNPDYTIDKHRAR